MDERLLSRLRTITEEEQTILAGQGVQRERYTSSRDFVVDSEKLLEKGKLIEIRPHTRFVHFPRHRHNYVEMLYMCSGSTTHILNGSRELVLRQGGSSIPQPGGLPQDPARRRGGRGGQLHHPAPVL